MYAREILLSAEKQVEDYKIKKVIIEKKFQMELSLLWLFC